MRRRTVSHSSDSSSQLQSMLLRCLLIFTLVQNFVGAICEQNADNSTEENVALSDEKRLIKTVLRNYEEAGVIGRPVANTSDKLVVTLSFGLIQILDLDEKNQVLTINAWSTYKWTDQFLKWEPIKYGGVNKVRVPPDKIWTPDIVLYNYADERLKEHRDVMCVVNHEGEVQWIPPAIFKSSCKIDIKNFPFDEQVCWLKFGSWTYDEDNLDIRLEGKDIDISDYTPSNEWEIIGRPARRNEKKYECCEAVYPDLTFFLGLRRNPAFFTYLLVLPCVLLSSLTLVIFWLPPESPAKMILGMNIFVAFFLLLLLLADSTPSASTSVPYIGFYYCLNMILITLSSFLSVFVINLYFRGDNRTRLPKFLRCFTRVMGKVLFMRLDLGHREDGERLRLIKAEIRNNRKHTQKQILLQQHQQQWAAMQKLHLSPASVPTQGTPSPLYSSTAPQHQSPPGSQPVAVNGGSNTMGPTGVHHQHWGHNHVHRGSSPPPMPAIVNPRVAASSVAGGALEHLMWQSVRSQEVRQQVTQAMEEDLREIRRALLTLMRRISSKEQNNRVAKEWRMIAQVMDRIFFICYFFLITFAGLLLLIPKDPHKTLDDVIKEYSKAYRRSQ